MNLKEEYHPHGSDGYSSKHSDTYYQTIDGAGGGCDIGGLQQWHYSPSDQQTQRVIMYDSLENDYNIRSATMDNENYFLPTVLGGE